MPAQPLTAQITTATAANAYDPSDLYLQAWYLIRDSETLAKQRDYLGALNKGKQAQQVLTKIANDHPDWKINMVRDRRDRLAQTILRYTEEARNNPVAPANPRIITEGKQPPNVEKPKTPTLPSFDELEAERRKKAAALATTQNIPEYRPNPPITAPPTIEASSSYERLEQEHQRTLMELRTVVKALKETRADLERVMTQSVKSSAGEKVYKEELDTLRKEIGIERKAGNTVLATLTDRLQKLESEQAAAIQQKAKDDAQIAQLQAQLADNEAQLTDITAERDALRQERDQLKTLLDLNSPAKTKALLDNNLTLAAKLKEAQDRLVTLEADKAASADQEGVLSKQLEGARTEIVQIKLSLANIRDENIGYRKRISDLNTKLINTEAELEKLSTKPNNEPIILEENQLLKEIVTKQIRTLKTLETAKNLLLAAYKRLKSKDPNLSEAFQLLDNKNALELSPAEKSIADHLASKIQAEDLDNSDLDDTANQQTTSNQDKIREALEIEALGNGAADAFTKGRYAGAEQLYKTLLDLRPDHLAALVNMGTIMIQRGIASEAIPRLTRATQLAPDMATPFFLLAIAQYNIGDDKTAVSSFSRAVQLDPANAEAYLYLGNIESTAGNFNKAIAHYRSALKIDDKLSDAHYNISQLCYRQNRLKEAKTAYDQAILAGAAPDPIFERQLRTPSPVTEDKNKQPEKPLLATTSHTEIQETPTTTTKTDPPETKSTPAKPAPAKETAVKIAPAKTTPAKEKPATPKTPDNNTKKSGIKRNPRSRFG